MMRLRDNLGKKILAIAFGLVFAISGLLAPVPTVSAIPETPNPTDITPEPPSTDDTSTTNTEPADTTESAEPTSETSESSETDEPREDSELCFNQVGAISWLVCPTSGFVASIVDTLYEAIEDFLIVRPLTSDENSSIRIIWEYARNISNIVFVIFFMVVIYSQITGIGLSNYSIKRTMPRIIITALLINLSFFICSIAVDISNIVGSGIRGIYNSVAEAVLANGSINPAAHFSVSELFGAVASGAVIAGLAIAVTPIGGQLIFMLIPVLVGVLVAVVVGLFTISLRQAVISLLVMISPLAFVAYLLPNTEKWFKKWSDIFKQMIVFYPMFALLFWASRLAGWALITSATSWLGVILGVAVQIAPLLFSISLMKMSGTILGKVSSALSGVGNRATGGVRRWSESSRENRRQRYYAQSKMPYARLQRYMDYRAQLREIDTENARTLRASRAMERAQRRIAKGYNPSTYDKTLKPNRYARLANDAGTAQLRAERFTKETAHVINNYGDHFTKDTGRKDTKGQPIREGKPQDLQRIERGKSAWLEYNRAVFTEQSDRENDFDFLVNEYINYEKLGHNSPEYQRFITSVAGPKGETSVLGQLIAHANAVEQRKRRDIAILHAKHTFSKANQRALAVGYYVNDNGLATKEDGHTLVEDDKGNTEPQPGYFLFNNPSVLVPYNVRDDNGELYYDWYDKDGNYVSRIYKKDGAWMKETFANQDIIINDHINSLYSILAGIEEGEITENGPLRNVGLKKFSTTIGRALSASGYNDKAAWATSMAANTIAKGQMSNYVHLNVERLDNIKKTVKPGKFNGQDAFEIKQLAWLMNPENWEKAFTLEGLRTRRNINGELLEGIDENGNPVDNAKAKYADFMRKIIKDYMIPAAQNMYYYMSRATQNTTDNQKKSAAEAFENLTKVFKEHWSQDEVTDITRDSSGKETQQVIQKAEHRSWKYKDIEIPLPDPSAQDGNFYETSRGIRRSLHRPQSKFSINSNHAQSNSPKSFVQQNHADAIDAIYTDFENTGDVEGFCAEIENYLLSYPDLFRAYEAFKLYRSIHWNTATLQDYYDDLMSYIDKN